MSYAPPVIYQQGAASWSSQGSPYGQQQQPYPPQQQPYPPQQGYQQPYPAPANGNPYPAYPPANQAAAYPAYPAAGGWAAPQGQQAYPSYPPPQQQQQQQQQQAYPSYPPPQQQQQQPSYQQQPYPQQQQAAAYSSIPASMPPAGSGGRKKALLVGCCYPGTSAALNGCINDVQCIQYCLKNRFGFSDASFMVLRDDTRDPATSPTRANIMRGIQWLMSDQRPGDSLFFHFSGHGSQQRDRTGQEADGMNETLLPTDHKRAGEIVDDELNACLVRPLQQGVTLHAIIDACHSGTALDLPFRTTTNNVGRFAWKFEQPMKGTSGGTVFQLGACKDSQVAADTNAMSGTAYTGAATFSFIEAVEKYGVQQTYAVLLQHMRDSLQKQGGAGGGLPIPQMGGLAGMGMKLVASFLLGPGAMGGQTPVLSCDKMVDLYNTKLQL